MTRCISISYFPSLFPFAKLVKLVKFNAVGCGLLSLLKSILTEDKLRENI